MSKKSKRQPRRPASPTIANPADSAPALRSTTEFNPDYSHVKRDLRRIGVLAGTFFIILVVISIFQNQLLALFVK
ncbi:MAG: hypothetical protein ACUVRJ_00120 [Candidatus Villigracilaceae bacterium]